MHGLSDLRASLRDSQGCCGSPIFGFGKLGMGFEPASCSDTFRSAPRVLPVIGQIQRPGLSPACCTESNLDSENYTYAFACAPSGDVTDVMQLRKVDRCQVLCPVEGVFTDARTGPLHGLKSTFTS